MPTTPLLLSLADTASILAQGAERADLEAIRDGFNDARWDMPWQLLVIGMGTVLVVVVTISAVRWWRTRYDDPSPVVLFSSIARKLGLGWADRVLLWRIARAAELSSPIALLLARGTLGHHAEAFCRGRGPLAQRRVRHRIKRIQARLFGQSARPTP